METLGYYNGKIAPIDEMTVPMNDRGGYFGDGVYEATAVVKRRLFAIDEHLDRLYNSAGLIGIQLRMTKAEMKALLEEMSAKVDSPDQFLYWQVTRGTAPRNHTYPQGVEPNLWMMIRPFTVPDLTVRKQLIVVEDTRFLHCHIKTLNLLPSVMACEQAKAAGCTEAVMHRNGRVTECSHSNISILKDGVLKTAPCDHLILPGIIRAHLIRNCKKRSIPVAEIPYTLEELYDADEVLVTSSSAICFLVDRIGERPVGGRDSATAEMLRDELLAEHYSQS